MNPFTTALSCMLALAAGQAPDNRDTRDQNYHRMEIVNGSRRSVHYFPYSQGDAESLRNLERAENEALLAGDLQNLRALYIRDEQYLEPIRRSVQERLYGGNHTLVNNQSSTMSTFYPAVNMSSFTPLSSPVSSSGFPLGGGFQANPVNGSGSPIRTGQSPTGTFNGPGQTIGGPNFNFVPGVTTNIPGMNGTFPTSMTNTGAGFFPGTGVGSFTPFGGVSPFNELGPTGSFFNNGGGFFNPMGLGGLGALGGLGVSSLFGGNGSFNPFFSLYGNGATSQNTTTQTSNFSLANGMGDEGRIKTAMAAVLAGQSTVDYQRKVAADLREARAAVRNREPYVSVTLKDGEKRQGRLVQQSAEWLVIRDGDEEHYVRTADITRMTKSRAGAATARLGR